MVVKVQMGWVLPISGVGSPWGHVLDLVVPRGQYGMSLALVLTSGQSLNVYPLSAGELVTDSITRTIQLDLREHLSSHHTSIAVQLPLHHLLLSCRPERQWWNTLISLSCGLSLAMNLWPLVVN